MGQHELAQVGVEREAVHTPAYGQHQHGGGAVQGVAGRHLLGAGLQKVGLGHVATAVWPAQDRENTAHRHIDIDVA